MELFLVYPRLHVTVGALHSQLIKGHTFVNGCQDTDRNDHQYCEKEFDKVTS